MSNRPIRRRVVYLSGTRADFGLMRSTLLLASERLDLAVAATGTHLSATYGNTVEEIRATGLRVCGEVEMDVLTRSPESMSIAIGMCLQGITRVLVREAPDALLLLGDRGEMLAGAIAALHLGIVSVHVHGGERSGTVDEPVRHAISKLSSYHCAATEQSRERLISMGENPQHIFVTGAPGLDGLLAEGSMSEQRCREEIGLPPNGPFLLALFHPVVQQMAQAYRETAALLDVVKAVGLPTLWLEPNADAGSLDVLRALDEASLPPGSRRVKHLSRPLFCAAMRHCAVLVGNSSAGIIEAASFGTPVVNIGERQHQRERNANVSDVPANAETIRHALLAALARGRSPLKNVYGDGKSGERIADLLCTMSVDRAILNKLNAY